MLKQNLVCRYDVFIRDFPYLFGRDTSYDRILRNVVKDHGSGTYHSMITYLHAPTDGSMRTYPNTVADRYRFRRFQALISLLSRDRCPAQVRITPGAMKHMSPIVIGLVSRKVTPKLT